MSTMFYSLTKKAGGKSAVLDRKKIPCFYMITDDEEAALDAGWKSFSEVIAEFEEKKLSPKLVRNEGRLYAEMKARFPDEDSFDGLHWKQLKKWVDDIGGEYTSTAAASEYLVNHYKAG